MTRSKRYGKPIVVRLHLDDEADVIRLAEDLGFSKSRVVRDLVYQALYP